MLDSGTTAPVPATTAGPDARLSIGEARAQIDDLDLRIIDLLRLRREVSHRIQQARLQAGGPRIDPGREAEIAQVYHSFFGEDGDDVAAVVLRVCRS
ncbi:chorismate mutase [Micromonospora sp. WMMA1363]|uniref:chorismate mutase n=1 Tax=Micromonospora sp. WMMA1363 TaxID=3053985 RepID=UPI00259D00DA|nr:chorismate mutase [Micromonospora sp. WMMA1363]MDM4719727.1 chorismate mutase [Micromonospora sp. WMMA1363]